MGLGLSWARLHTSSDADLRNSGPFEELHGMAKPISEQSQHPKEVFAVQRGGGTPAYHSTFSKLTIGYDRKLWWRRVRTQGCTGQLPAGTSGVRFDLANLLGLVP